MELDELDCYIKTYGTEVKPKIENGDYEGASTYLTGLLSILLEEQIKRNLTMNFNVYLPSAIASATNLKNFLEEKNIHGIERENRILEINLKQYKMRLEALANKS